MRTNGWARAVLLGVLPFVGCADSIYGNADYQYDDSAHSRAACAGLTCGESHGVMCGTCTGQDCCEANQCKPVSVGMTCGSDGGTATDPCATVCNHSTGGQAFTCTSPAGETNVRIDSKTANGCSISYGTGGGYWPIALKCDVKQICNMSDCVPVAFGSSGGATFTFDTTDLHLYKYYYPTGSTSCGP